MLSCIMTKNGCVGSDTVCAHPVTINLQKSTDTSTHQSCTHSPSEASLLFMSTVLPVPAAPTSITGRCRAISRSMKKRTRTVSVVVTTAACSSDNVS